MKRSLPVRRGTASDGQRLPVRFLVPLAAALAVSALLPPTGAWLVALGIVILGGVPHGALDGEVVRPWLRPRFGWAWFGVFALPYLSLSAAVLLAWRAAPLGTLAAFLAISVLHFGEEDAGPGRWLEAVARGGLPVALPALLHPAATASVFGTAVMVPMSTLPGWLAGASALWIPAMAAAVVTMVRKRRFPALAEMAGLACAFWALPPLTAFALYFVGFHAPRHMAVLASDPARAPRVTTMRTAVLRSLPVTAVTLVLGGMLWRFYPGPAPERLLALTLQGLAALTLPHLLLDRLTAHAERQPMPGARVIFERIWRRPLNGSALQEKPR